MSYTSTMRLSIAIFQWRTYSVLWRSSDGWLAMVVTAGSNSSGGLCVTQDAGFEPLADTMTAPDSIQPCSFASDHAPQTHAGAQEMASRMVEPLVKS